VLKQSHIDENSGLVNDCLLVCTTRWMQEKVMHIIGVAHAMKQAIIGKQSQYMPTKPANIYVLRLQDRHQSKDVFADIVRIFNFNMFLIYF
jgi:hypothetical protein